MVMVSQIVADILTMNHVVRLRYAMDVPTNSHESSFGSALCSDPPP